MKTFLIRAMDKALVGWLAWAASACKRQRKATKVTAPPRRTMVIKLVGMGDAVLMLPALVALRRADGHLAVITTRRCAPVFSAPGIADEVITLRRAGLWRHGKAALRALRLSDAVLDFEQHVYWSAALTAMAPGASMKYGFRTPSRRRNSVYTHLVAPGDGIRHMKEIFDDLARAAGALPASALIPLPVAARSQQTAEVWLQEHNLAHNRYWLAAPGSGGTVTFRRLAPEAWADILDGLPSDMAVVVAGTWHEAALLNAIEQRTRRTVEVATHLAIGELAEVMRHAAGVIATDSGPMHLAAAMGVRTVGVFGPDAPARYRPYGRLHESVWLGLACSPCNNCWRYREARCTNPKRYACIGGITPQQVLEVALETSGRAAASATEGAHDHG